MAVLFKLPPQPPQAVDGVPEELDTRVGALDYAFHIGSADLLLSMQKAREKNVSAGLGGDVLGLVAATSALTAGTVAAVSAFSYGQTSNTQQQVPGASRAVISTSPGLLTLEPFYLAYLQERFADSKIVRAYRSGNEHDLEEVLAASGLKSSDTKSSADSTQQGSSTLLGFFWSANTPAPGSPAKKSFTLEEELLEIAKFFQNLTTTINKVSHRGKSQAVELGAKIPTTSEVVKKKKKKADSEKKKAKQSANTEGTQQVVDELTVKVEEESAGLIQDDIEPEASKGKQELEAYHFEPEVAIDAPENVALDAAKVDTVATFSEESEVKLEIALESAGALAEPSAFNIPGRLTICNTSTFKASAG
ncbi:hypothetical protein HDU96_009540 [Phlyctochytrium bullatum]|nr:hypothetical protein HDU96_009540 [Phlyctochytrium bullatum]